MATKKKNTENGVEAREPKAQFRTPAAITAAEKGFDTYVVVVSKRYPTDKSRYLKVDANPDVIIPTEEEVEVAENEYYELKNSAALRKKAIKMLEKLKNETFERGAAL